MTGKPDELTEAAKAEIAAAIAIVREDRIDKLIRERLSASPADPPKPDPPKPDPGPNPPTDPPGPPPPPPNPPTDPPQDPPKKRGLYWGDAVDD